MTPVWEIAVHLAVAGGVYGGVFFVLSLFSRDVLDEILDLIESVSESFLTYSFVKASYILFKDKVFGFRQVQSNESISFL